jgi:TPR repeat protein
MYYAGLGVTKDLVLARSWFQKSADEKNVEAKRRLGVMMAIGEGGTRKVSQGVALVEEAAEKGDIAAIKLMQNFHPIIDASWCEPDTSLPTPSLRGFGPDI